MEMGWDSDIHSRNAPTLGRSAADPAWIFVSHASADIKTVRVIRNYLEDLGAAPLLFHLLALKNAEDFWPLIEKEIAARNFFLFCQSEAAEKSEWVQRERAFVEDISVSRPLKIGRVELFAMDRIESRLAEFVSRTRVYLSYTRRDRDICKDIENVLASQGFQVFGIESLVSAVSFVDQLAREIEFTAHHGFFIPIVTNNYRESVACRDEFHHAEELRAPIVPFIIDPRSSPPAIAKYSGIQADHNIVDAAHRLATVLLKWQ